jgi:Tfp pilus assembly protein PilN
VVEAPLSCCKAIAQVIVEVTGDRRYWNQLESIANLLPQRPWTVAEAKRMARNNYRLSYLKEEVRGVLRRKKGSLSILQKPKRGKK